MQGTMEQLVNRGITVNGIYVDAAMLSVLIRCGIGQYVSEGNKPARGRTPKIYRFVESNQLKIVVNYEK